MPVLLLALLLAGCGLRPETEARSLPTDAPVLDVRPARPVPSGPSRERLFLVRDDRLVGVPRATGDLSARSALQDLLAGPTPVELVEGFTTALPATTRATLADVRSGVAVVELRGDLVGSGRSDQVLALAQVVATLDAAPGVDAVRFVQDGRPLPVPRSDGALSDRPLTSADYRSLLPG